MARVLVIRQFAFPGDIRVRREVEALLSDGHEVDVVCLGERGKPLHERWRGARVVRVPLGHRRGGPIGYLLQYSAFGAAATVLAAVLHLRRRYQLVQVHSLPDPLVFAAVVPRVLGARVLLDLHETMPEFFATRFGRDPDSFATRAVVAGEQASIRFASHVITCTEQMKEAFVARGAAPETIDVVLNSADESLFDVRRRALRPRESGRFTLIIHGTVEERYGIDTTIEAMALLEDELPELELQVYGRGSYLDELMRLAEARGVRDRVHFQRDWVPFDELIGALADADAGVVAMKRDAFRDLTHCNKMYELITMRRPTLMSRTRSVEAYFDVGSFAWFESDDAADLARAIRRLHDDPQWAQQLVDHATLRNEPYRWVNQRRHYLEVVRRLLATGRHGDSGHSG
jgi:glycosyltransferase involved in cell wall biosynthesis